MGDGERAVGTEQNGGGSDKAMGDEDRAMGTEQSDGDGQSNGGRGRAIGYRMTGRGGIQNGDAPESSCESRAGSARLMSTGPAGHGAAARQLGPVAQLRAR